MGALLVERRIKSNARLEDLKSHLAGAARFAGSHACVYATGSFARGEASIYSDLDLFIVGRTGEKSKRMLKRLDEICMKAELIKATREFGIPEFSGDGEYLKHYTVSELVTALGTQEDDSLNTFTARLLLLLESRPLFGDDVYQEAITGTLKSYWRDYADHERDFLPAFLSNDILRLWRTFCVNYEARTVSEPEPKKAKRRLKNYKLKHSRLLTCYSALLQLVALWREQGTVSLEEATRVVSMSPTDRLEDLLTKSIVADAHGTLNALLGAYEQFLEETDAKEEDLIAKLMDQSNRGRMLRAQHTFGVLMFEAIQLIGAQTSFHRMLVV